MKERGSIGGLVLCLAIIAAAIGLYAQTARYPVASRAYPRGVLLFLVGLGLVQLLVESRAVLAGGRNRRVGEPPKSASMRQLLVTALLCVGYVALMNRLGYFVSTVLFALLVLVHFGERRVRSLLLLPLGLVTFVFLFFTVTLRVPMPRGLLF